MEQKILKIKWDTGSMEINLDKFFPCAKTEFNKLLKIIELDWQYHEELRESLKDYFQNRIQRLPEEIKDLQQDVVIYKEKAAKLKEQMKAERKKRRKQGLPPVSWSVNNEYETCMDTVREAERRAKFLLNSKPKLEGYLKLL